MVECNTYMMEEKLLQLHFCLNEYRNVELSQNGDSEEDDDLSSTDGRCGERISVITLL